MNERTNEMKGTNYTENANEQTYDTPSERTIHETNERYTKRTNDTRNERTIHETNDRYTSERIIGA